MGNPALATIPLESNLAGTATSGTITLVGVDPVRYDGGLWMEEGTTNVVENADFATNTSGWTVNGSGSVVLTRRTDTGLAAHVCQVACDGSGGSQGIFLANGVAASVGQLWALSVDIAGAVGGETCRMIVSMRNSGGSQISELASSPFVVTNGMVRYTYLVTITEALTATIRVKVLGPATLAAQTFHVDGFQLENHGYATSLALSTMGAGYSAGVGGVHVRAASSASISPAGILSPASGAIAFRVTPTIETGVEEIWGECGTKGTGTDHIQWGRDASKHPFVEWSSDDGSYQRLTSVETADAGTEHFVLIGHNGTDVFIKAAGGARESGTRDAVEGSFGAGDLVLKASVGGNVVGSLATFNRMLTDAEIYTVEHTEHWSMGMLGNEMVRRIRAQFELRPY